MWHRAVSDPGSSKLSSVSEKGTTSLEYATAFQLCDDPESIYQDELQALLDKSKVEKDAAQAAKIEALENENTDSDDETSSEQEESGD